MRDGLSPQAGRGEEGRPPVMTMLSTSQKLSLILRSGVFAASRRMIVQDGLMVRDGADAPPHHEDIPKPETASHSGS
jgi:hypothetical protein